VYYVTCHGETKNEKVWKGDDRGIKFCKKYVSKKKEMERRLIWEVANRKKGETRKHDGNEGVHVLTSTKVVWTGINVAIT